MINMPYCRFENTLAALRECDEHIEDYMSASEPEREAAEQLCELCASIARRMGYVP